MVELEKRFYSLTEIRELVGSNRKETISGRLEKWGYRFEFIPRRGVEIKELPSEGTPGEQLKSLLMRKLDLDSRTDFKAFSAFFYLLMDDELFLTTPWETRAEQIKKQFNIEISERTLRTYMSKLVKKNMAVKSDDNYEYWYTTYVGVDKVQDVVWDMEDDIKAMEDWFNKRKQYLDAADVEYRVALGNPEGTELNPNRWKMAINKLWDETKTVYYKVKGWQLNAFEDKDIKEIYRLSALVIADIKLDGNDVEEIIEKKVSVRDTLSCTADGSFVF